MPEVSGDRADGLAGGSRPVAVWRDVYDQQDVSDYMGGAKEGREVCVTMMRVFLLCWVFVLCASVPSADKVSCYFSTAAPPAAPPALPPVLLGLGVLGLLHQGLGDLAAVLQSTQPKPMARHDCTTGSGRRR